MGDAELPHRSSSPLKRPASDLEGEHGSSEATDVVMSEQPYQGGEADIQPGQNQPHGALSNDGEAGATHFESMEGLQHSSQAVATSTPDAPANIPTIDEQIAAVKALLDAFDSQPLQAETITYIISNAWLERVLSRGSGSKTTPRTDEPVGPVDNSDLIGETVTDQNDQPFVRLKEDVTQEAFRYFPREAWELVTEWYGLKEGQEPIIRKAVDTSYERDGSNIIFELHPRVFTIHRLWAAHSPIPIDQILKARNPAAPVFVLSGTDKVMEFVKNAKRRASIPVTQKIRLWTTPSSLAKPSSTTGAPLTGAMTDAGAVEQDVWSRLLVEVPAFLALPRGSNPETDRQLLDTVKDETNNPNYNGSSTLDMAGIGSDFGIVLDELVEGHQFLSAYVVRDSKKSPKHLTITGTTSNKAVVATVTDSGRSSPAPATGAVTRGRMNRSGKTIGTVGLSNLGNTCYMNSALQCLRNVEELTKYFLAGQAENELNTENPLGKGGHIAMVYNSLLKEIYKDQVPSSVAPRQFKNTFGRYFGSFSGYGQQDSQEFLGILLDALQEDLNRIKKKPYIEKPDSTDEMVNDPKALAKMADQVWDISKKRDDSVIGDLFAGMYKSTLVCPECAKVSITFDPFNTVTLQLPIENTWSHELRFFPLNGKPYKIIVDMDKHGSIKTLKEFVSQRTRVPTERLFLAETFKDHFYKFYEDMKPVSEEITKEDMVNIYELERAPTNWPPRNVKNRSLSSPSQEDEQEQYNLIPVLQRKEQAKSSYNHNYTWTLQPFFIVLSPEESCNEEAVRRKVLEQVINQTTFHWEESDSGESNDDSLDQDVVVTTGSDASSGDGKVIATSVDGEDDVVDVSMKERTAQDSSETMTDIQERKRKFHSKRPRWVTDLKAPVNFDAYTDLFELGYFKGSGEEVVPVGWSMSPDQEPMKLSSRYVRRPDPVTVNVRKGSLESDIESDDSPKELPELAATRMNDESSEEDSAPSHTNILPVRPIAHRPVFKVGHHSGRFRNGARTYSKKDLRRPLHMIHAYLHHQDTAPEIDQRPLIRPGEGIIVEWNSGPFDTLFEGGADDSLRGTSTVDPRYMETLPDPVLQAKREARQKRRRNGITLGECLDEFGKEEILSEMDTWYCPRCKEHRRASKKLELYRTPDILVFHLKRFSSAGYRRDKLDVLVDFPIDSLDLTQKVLFRQDGKAEIYDLFAVDNHYGGLGGGHYTAYAKSFVDGAWYDYNDSSVSKVHDPKQVISTAAYLLFYRRRSDVPLGGPRFKEIVESLANPSQEDEDSSASGEDRRLGADSSLRGSSSAFNGVEAAHHLGRGSALGATVAAAAAADTALPSYESALDGEDGGAPLLRSDAIMNDGVQIAGQAAFNEDEAIDMDSGFVDFPAERETGTGAFTGGWSFQNISDNDFQDPANSANEDEDIRSTDAESGIMDVGGSVSDQAREDRLKDFLEAEVDDDYIEQDPIPDMSEEQMGILQLHADLVGRGGAIQLDMNVPPPDIDEDDLVEDATEIHVKEGEGL